MTNIESVARATFLSDGSLMLERQCADGTWSTLALDVASMMTVGGSERGDELTVTFTGRVAGPVHSHATIAGNLIKVSVN
jgi:hypothetical protein